MDHVQYLFAILQDICSMFNGFFIRYHLYNLDISRISRNKWKKTGNLMNQTGISNIYYKDTLYAGV